MAESASDSNRMRRERGRLPGLFSGTMAVPVLIALIDLVIHLAVANNYGYFRDELYYIAAGHHLAFGYVDFPPMIAVLAALLNLIANDNLFALHVVTALAASAIVIVTALMARELGGGRLAQTLAALGSAVTVVFMATGSLFSMDIFDALWWSLAALVFMRLIRRDDPRLWLLFGLVAGIGVTTKVTMLFFGFALTVGLALSARQQFRSRWLYLGGLIAALCLLPYVIWNAVNGWPTLGFWQNYGGADGGGPLSFFANQILSANPINLLLTVTGLVYYFRHPAGKPYRALGWAYVVLYLLFTILNSKSYFLLPAYPMLYAGGALQLEGVFQRRRWRWARTVVPVLVALNGIMLAPLAMPMLSPSTFAKTYSHLTGTGNSGAGQSTAGVFPQYLGDRFGWTEMAATLSTAYHQLPAAEQAQACIFTVNYGEASALNFYAKKYNLPPAISGHNNFYLWGPGDCSGQVILTVGQSRSDVEKSYNNVVQVAINRCNYCMEEESDIPIFLGTDPKFQTVREIWPQTKHFN